MKHSLLGDTRRCIRSDSCIGSGRAPGGSPGLLGPSQELSRSYRNGLGVGDSCSTLGPSSQMLATPTELRGSRVLPYVLREQTGLPQPIPHGLALPLHLRSSFLPGMQVSVLAGLSVWGLRSFRVMTLSRRYLPSPVRQCPENWAKVDVFH